MPRYRTVIAVSYENDVALEDEYLPEEVARETAEEKALKQFQKEIATCFSLFDFLGVKTEKIEG